jgi:hypothetical protein
MRLMNAEKFTRLMNAEKFTRLMKALLYKKGLD